MISDEIDTLHQRGQTDEQIASIIQRNSAIQITADEIAENYAPPEQRHPRVE